MAFGADHATSDRITTRSPGNGAGGVGRYNAEGNRPSPTAELLRCNAKVIRPEQSGIEQSVRRELESTIKNNMKFMTFVLFCVLLADRLPLTTTPERHNDTLNFLIADAELTA